MARWENKNQWDYPSEYPLASGRRVGRLQDGVQGDKVVPTDYYWIYGKFPQITPKLNNGAYAPDVDVPNLSMPYYMSSAKDSFVSIANDAWSDLVDSARNGPAQLGVAFAEAGESLGMIEKRAKQLYRGMQALRRGRFGDFLGTFGLTAKKRHRSLLKRDAFTKRKVAQHASNLWLEYSFGWSPLTKDMYDATHSISKPIPGGYCKGKAKGQWSVDTGFEKFVTTVYCNNSAWIYVTNPNLYLAQQLGLANPATILWELIPFSFVVDWFTDFGAFLGGMTDFAGCTIHRPRTTFSVRGIVTCYVDDDDGTRKSLDGHVASGYRYSSLIAPMPNLNFRANFGKSLRRAANAVSLLVQILLGRN